MKKTFIVILLLSVLFCASSLVHKPNKITLDKICVVTGEIVFKTFRDVDNRDETVPVLKMISPAEICNEEKTIGIINEIQITSAKYKIDIKYSNRKVKISGFVLESFKSHQYTEFILLAREINFL